MPVTDPATPRTQVQRRAESEELLLSAAAELVAERGIDRASLASIGERAGSSRGLPTHHFGSKDALVARLARRAQDRVGDATAAAFERRRTSSGDAPGLERVRVTVDAYLELFEHPTADARALLVMWGATFPSEAEVDGMIEAQQTAYAGWTDTIRQGQHDGSIRQDLDPVSAAVVLFGMMRGVAALLVTDAELIDMTGARRTCDEWISAALEPREHRTS